MGKVKRKHRLASTFSSPLSPSVPQTILPSSSSTSSSPPKSVSPSARSLSSCSSSSSLSSPCSSTSSPSSRWPLSLSQSQVPLSSYTTLDDDSGLGSTEQSTYSPLKVARFNQAAHQQHHNQQQQHSSAQLGFSAPQHEMSSVKAPFSKRTPSALPPTSAELHQHHHHHFMPPMQVNYPPSVTVVNGSAASASSIAAAQSFSSVPPSGSSPNRVLLVPPMRKSSSSSTTNGVGNSQSGSQNNCTVNASKMSPSSYSSRSKNGKYELKILSQPEEQHRARYLTEGSRGAIKDKSGHGYPVVKLCGYSRQPVKIQCFIGHDKHIGTPHLFYQASKIAGKNSTACFIKKVDGTSIITMEASPANNMEINVDCIGILKERNVDVEQKLNKFQRIGSSSDTESQSVANIKRSTRCRLVFRCELPETAETLQTVSAPILCTQPLGTPEINKKSLSQCDIGGGTELFIIGKNFLKDAKVIFRNEKWIKIVEPNREYLKSTHLICMIPAYDASSTSQKANHRQRSGKSLGTSVAASTATSSPPPQVIEVNLMVKSGGKCSDPHKFYYTIGCSDATLPDIASVASPDHHSDALSPYEQDSNDGGKHANEVSPYVSPYQLDTETNVVANQAHGHTSTDMLGSNAMSNQLTNEMGALGPATKSESLEPSSGVVCEPSVLAAAAVVAANEVQALCDTNQLTAANLHQTVTTAAAVAVAATEAVLAENNNSNSVSADTSTQLPAIPGPPNQAAVAVVAAQINSMIPYLTISDTVSALAAAAAVKQEVESESSSQPAAAAIAISQSSATQYMMNTSSMMTAPSVMPTCGQDPFPTNLVPSSSASVLDSNSSIQSMMCSQNMAPLNNSPQLNVLNQTPVLSTFGTEQVNMVGTTASHMSRMNNSMSMDTNSVSFANLTHGDPMNTLKVDNLTINDKAPLPQLSLSDISTQLSMPAQVPVHTVPSNMGLNSINTIMASPEVSNLSSSNQIHSVETVSLVNGSIVTMMSNQQGQKQISVSNLSSAVGPLLESTNPNHPSASVIMGPSNYGLVPTDSKCSNSLIATSYGQVKPSLVNLPQNDFMNPTASMVTDLKSALTSNMLGQITVAQPVQHVQVQSQPSNVHSQDKVNGPIETFIHNMQNESLVTNQHSNSPTEQQLAVNTMLTSQQQNNTSPSYMNSSLINHSDCSSSSQMLSNGMLTVQPSQQSTTGVITTGPTAPQSGRGSVMMDTLPSRLSTTQGEVILTRGTNALGHSVTLITGMGGAPVHFTDNVEMGGSVPQTPTQPSMNASSNQQFLQHMASQSMIVSDQSTAHTSATIADAKDTTANATVSVASLASGTVLANHQPLVHPHQQQQPQQSTSLHTLSNLSEAELINFINPSTFE